MKGNNEQENVFRRINDRCYIEHSGKLVLRSLPKKKRLMNWTKRLIIRFLERVINRLRSSL
jgi:hypothetical protein